MFRSVNVRERERSTRPLRCDMARKVWNLCWGSLRWWWVMRLGDSCRNCILFRSLLRSHFSRCCDDQRGSRNCATLCARSFSWHGGRDKLIGTGRWRHADRDTEGRIKINSGRKTKPLNECKRMQNTPDAACFHLHVYLETWHQGRRPLMNSATPGKRLMQSSKSTKQSAQSCAISPSPLVITVMNEFKQMHWTNARERRTHPTQLVSMHVYLQTWHREDILWKDSCKTWNL